MVPVPRPAAAPPIGARRLAMPWGNSEVRDACRAADSRPIVLDSLLPPQASSRGGMGSLSTHSRRPSWNSRDADAISDTLWPISNAWAQVPPLMLAPATRCLGGDTRFGAWTFTRALWRTFVFLGKLQFLSPRGGQGMRSETPVQ